MKLNTANELAVSKLKWSWESHIVRRTDNRCIKKISKAATIDGDTDSGMSLKIWIHDLIRVAICCWMQGLYTLKNVGDDLNCAIYISLEKKIFFVLVLAIQRFYILLKSFMEITKNFHWPKRSILCLSIVIDVVLSLISYRLIAHAKKYFTSKYMIHPTYLHLYCTKNKYVFTL